MVNGPAQGNNPGEPPHRDLFKTQIGPSSLAPSPLALASEVLTTFGARSTNAAIALCRYIQPSQFVESDPACLYMLLTSPDEPIPLRLCYAKLLNRHLQCTATRDLEIIGELVRALKRPSDDASPKNVLLFLVATAGIQVPEVIAAQRSVIEQHMKGENRGPSDHLPHVALLALSEGLASASPFEKSETPAHIALKALRKMYGPDSSDVDADEDLQDAIELTWNQDGTSQLVEDQVSYLVNKIYLNATQKAPLEARDRVVRTPLAESLRGSQALVWAHRLLDQVGHTTLPAAVRLVSRWTTTLTNDQRDQAMREALNPHALGDTRFLAASILRASGGVDEELRDAGLALMHSCRGTDNFVGAALLWESEDHKVLTKLSAIIAPPKPLDRSLGIRNSIVAQLLGSLPDERAGTVYDELLQSLSAAPPRERYYHGMVTAFRWGAARPGPEMAYMEWCSNHILPWHGNH